jgi:transcriptional regulator GlxA family with amidase domain
MRTSSRHVALVVFDEVDLLDVAGFCEVLSVAGRQWNWRPFRLFVASADGLQIATRSQLRIEAHGRLADCPAPEILVIPGGYGARRKLGGDDLVTWLQGAAMHAALTAAVGYGVLPLASAGLLKGTRIAASTEVSELVREIDDSVETSNEGIVCHENLITAAASAGAIDAALEIVARTLGKKQADAVAAKIGHQPATAPASAVRLTIE